MMKMQITNRLAALILGIAFTIGGLTLSSVHAETQTQTPVHTREQVDIPVWVVRPCAQEDSVNCRWIASSRGNGKGHTFIVREVPGSKHMICVFYAQRRYAKHHDYCS